MGWSFLLKNPRKLNHWRNCSHSFRKFRLTSASAIEHTWIAYRGCFYVNKVCCPTAVLLHLNKIYIAFSSFVVLQSALWGSLINNGGWLKCFCLLWWLYTFVITRIGVFPKTGSINLECLVWLILFLLGSLQCLH